MTFNLRFPGQYYDLETGLHYNYYRDYDPQTGRYIESDPVGFSGGISAYLYAYANPLRSYDPLGLEAERNWTCCDPPLRKMTDQECCNHPVVQPRSIAVGGVVCCMGRIVSCVFDYNLPRTYGYYNEAVKQCIIEHENRHWQDTPKCSCNTVEHMPGKPGMSEQEVECPAYQVGLDCLHKRKDRCPDRYCHQALKEAITDTMNAGYAKGCKELK